MKKATVYFVLFCTAYGLCAQQGMMESSIGQSAVEQENGINEISDISQALIVADPYPNPTSGELTVTAGRFVRQ